MAIHALTLERECPDILAAEISLDRAFCDQGEATHPHCRQQPLAREIPAMLIRLEMLAAQCMLGVAKDRQRNEQPFAHIGEERLKIRDMLEHIPERCSIE